MVSFRTWQTLTNRIQKDVTSTNIDDVELISTTVRCNSVLRTAGTALERRRRFTGTASSRAHAGVKFRTRQ